MKVILDKLEDFWYWITDIDTWVSIIKRLLVFALCIYLVLLFLYKTFEFFGVYDAKCVYTFEDLNGNIHEAENCRVDGACYIDDRYYTYKWFEKKCEE